MRRLLLVPLALLLMHCSGNAVKPQPGSSNAGTNAGNGSTGHSSSGSTGTTGVTTTSGTSIGTTSGSGSSTSAGTTTTGGTTSSGSSSATSASSSGSSGSTGVSSNGSSGSTGGSGSTGTSATTSSGSTGATTTGTTTTGTTTTGTTTTGGSTGGTVTQALVRVADFITNQPVAIDFCVKPTTSSTWGAPELAQFGGSLNSGHVTLYFPFDDVSASSTGTTYDVAVILAGGNSTACATSTNTTTLTAVGGTYKTIVASGSPLAPTYTVLTDDTTVGGTETKYRFMNASPDTNVTSVDFGTVTSGNVSGKLLTGVTYPNLGTNLVGSGNLNGRDYVVVAAQSSATYGVRNHSDGSSNSAMLGNSVTDTLSGGTLHSFFFSGTQSAFKLTDCLDVLTAPANGNQGLTTCQ